MSLSSKSTVFFYLLSRLMLRKTKALGDRYPSYCPGDEEQAIMQTVFTTLPELNAINTYSEIPQKEGTGISPFANFCLNSKYLPSKIPRAKYGYFAYSRWQPTGSLSGEMRKYFMFSIAVSFSACQ